MTVFKGNMLLLKRNIGIGLMYFAIFIGITLIFQMSAGQEDEVITFDVVNSKIGIVDLDESTLSRGLIQFLEESNRVTMYENDQEVLTEALYYDEVYSIIVIPESFEEDCASGTAVVDITNAPNIYSTMYVDMDINKYVFQVQTLVAAGFEGDEIVSIAIENANVDSGVELIEVGNERIEVPQYAFFFRYSPYVFLSVLIFLLGNIYIPMNEKDMLQRLRCCAVSDTRNSFETFLAFAVAGGIVFAAMMICAFVFYSKDLLTDDLFGYYMLNNLVLMIVSLCVAFAVASVAKGQEALSGLANIVSLGLCFLGGVFVPLSLLGSGVENVSKFLPTYWYELNNEMLGNYAHLNATQLVSFRNGVLAQLAIAAVCITIAFFLNSRKEIRKTA
jgi:ABC-2 type transport system permease protein